MRLLNKAFVRLTALAIAFALAPSAFALDGSIIAPGGGEIKYTGASSVETVPGSTDVLLVYSNATETTASFELPGMTSARILAVGGGGGGGGAYQMGFSGTRGGGAGGGAGGFVELAEAFYGKGVYAVTVGEGGKAGTVGMNMALLAGGPGGDTTIKANGIPMITAYGGGGGGAECAGGDGASGGGGSQKNGGSAQNGGTNLVVAAGQGHAGGRGDAALYGGGGGGAGAEGWGASSNKVHGIGGAGRPSSITCAAGTPESEWPWYAGGGGGGWSSSSGTVPAGLENGIPGGKGGGGAGGVARNKNINPVAGRDGYGGGGGGANGNTTGVRGGAKGGSGVVYVRISSAMEGEFKKPATYQEHTFSNYFGFVSVENTMFYDVVSGQNVGTNVGTYVAHVKLHDGVSWPDGTYDELDVTNVIKACPVRFSDVQVADWTYHEAPSVPTCTVDPAWVKTVWQWTKKGAGDWHDWADEQPSEAGEYELRASAPDDGNYTEAAGSEPTAEFAVRKVVVTFSGLKIRNWMSGTPDEDTPSPTCTVDPSWVECVYGYADAPDAAEWGAKPTAAGTHYVRVSPPNDVNYEIAPGSTTVFKFTIFGGLGNIFTDYVEIVVTNRTDTDLVNFPCPVELCETNPPGFLYARAGGTGNDLAFTDQDGTQTLAYKVDEWNTNGTSRVFVKLPALPAHDAQTIRLYWNVRVGENVPAHFPESVWEDWENRREEWAELAEGLHGDFQAVYRDGKFVDYWVEEPEMSSYYWDMNGPEAERGRITRDAKLAFGRVVRKIVNVVTGETYDDIPNVGGIYRLSYEPDDPLGEFEYIECHRDFSVIGHEPFDDLKGGAKTLTLSGRVMLANDDVAAGHEVLDQAYWRVREVVTNSVTGATLTNDVFWTHAGEEHGTFSNQKIITHMLPGTEHKLQYVDGGRVKTLWRMKDVIIGNTVRDDKALYSYQCVMPWSATGLGNTSYAERNARGEMLEAGNLILRNTKSAVVYSPCYTNGIGTIYFDALNSNDNDGSDPYHIVVEVATKTKDGDDPTDENARDPSMAGINGELAKITAKEWKACDMEVFYCESGKPLAPQAVTNDFALAAEAGQSTNSFYRICARVNERGCSRFRIRRLYSNDAPGKTADSSSLILLDNIIVSHPAMGVDVEPFGHYEEDRAGKQVLGWGGAMVPPFPAVTDEAIFGRCKAVPYVSGATNVSSAGFITRSRMHYRWHYLDRASNDWDCVDLQPADGFVAQTPLALPRHEGDVEFWFESNVNVPFYDYFDYSGLGIRLLGPDNRPCYTEERTTVTNRLDDGSNWFFRYRSGRSDVESFALIVKESETAEPREIAMELSSDHVWRGYCQTLKPVEGAGLYVRFEARNRQAAGSESYASNVTHYVLHLDVTDLKEPTSLAAATGPDQWSRVVCDARTGYLLFQLSDATYSATVVHADYQNFNRWNDANVVEDGRRVFVGTSTFTNDLGMSGVSATAKDYPEAMGKWRDSIATNKYWSESFLATEAEMAGGDYAVYEPFPKAKSPNGWSVGPGQWVTANYRDAKSGMALQMKGRGEGFIQFVNANETPRGVESIQFSARIGQAVEFDDFSYFDGDKTELTNYTFFCRGTYDVNNRRDFSGNASLSVAAFYRAGEGAYELRVEQDTASFTSDKVTGPGSVQRLTLYRWNYDDVSGEVVATALGSTTYDNAATLTTMGEKGNYGLLFISAKNTGSATEVCAGLSTGVAAIDNVSKTSCRWLSYVDDSDARLTSGAYGVVSANCPARFRYLNYCSVATTCPTTKKQTIDARTQDFTFPDVKYRTTGVDDLNAKRWAVKRQRMAQLDWDNKVNFGLQAKAVTNTVYVYVAPKGSDDFTQELMKTNISNFGTVEPFVIPLWTTNECSVQIRPGGTSKTVRTDIVVDDLLIRQWRGESYNGKAGSVYFDDLRYGSPTNFVFTQAWIEKGFDGERVCTLSAKRSSLDEPTSVRSPLMDGQDGCGKGLGMIAFTYADAQTNVNLLVQIATNRVTRGVFADVTAATADAADWTTVTNFSFEGLSPAELASGMRSCYFGLHGVTGAMRIVLDPKCVEAVSNVTDEAAFGQIQLTGLLCRDEPELDGSSWWGWNIRTTDETDKLSLWDETPTGLGRGMALALNNSITADIRDRDAEFYPQHLPFVQTPVFDPDAIGEISFKASKFSPDDPDTRVVLFGARNETADDGSWEKLEEWTVADNLFTNCTYKTPPGLGYRAFRLAVTGVSGVNRPMEDPDAPNEPLRILLDEVVVMDAIRARIAFRNTAAFRQNLDKTRAIYDILSSAEQPLCHESFGVQTEIYVAQLESEVDLSTAKVRLWWYEGDDVWGFRNWTNKAHKAWLKPAEGTNLVFRSSHPLAPDAIIDPQERPGVVQYMLEVQYETQGVRKSDFIERSDWETPPWYHPVDYNRSREAEGFSPFTILDEVAPGYAWINEVNVYDGPSQYQDTSVTNQYVEVAVPSEANISNWRLRFVSGGLGDDAAFYTNTVAVFGDDVPAEKSVNGASNYVFITVGNQYSCTPETKKAGTVDGAWKVRDYTSDSTQVLSDGRIDAGYPIGIQLVRPSGIIEQQIVFSGTNSCADIPYYGDIFSATNFTAKLRRLDPKGKWFLAGEDVGELPQNGLSATNQFAREGSWASLAKTPGRINEGEFIAPDHPTPNGSSVILYANIEGGHVNQTSGAYERSVENLVLYVPKGSARGTNIVYRTDRWYEIESITENGRAVPGFAGEGVDGEPVTFTTAVFASNNVTVVVKARIKRELREDYGLDAANPYTEAVMKWLTDAHVHRTDAEGNAIAFAHPEGPLRLADYVDLADNLVGPLSLTDMYWLDMDPTMGDLVLKAGTRQIAAPSPTPAVPYPPVTLSVTMMISNRTDAAFAPYPPYVLRGLEPDSLSSDYDGVWKAETFRVMGRLLQGDTEPVVLKYYVFGPESFGAPGTPQAFTSQIRLDYPYAPPSPGFYAGWGNYPNVTIGWDWSLDAKDKQPVAPQILKSVVP